MKYGHIYIAILAMFVLGCSKSKPPITPYYPDDYGDFAYKIEGLQDTGVQRLGSTTMMVYVKKLSGPSEDVLFSVEGLPEGVTLDFEPATAKPPLNLILNIKAKKTPVGTYPIVIVGYSKTSGTQRTPINLVVRPNPNEAAVLAGPFKESHSCNQSGGTSFNVFVEPTSVNNRINIKGFWSSSWSNIIYADLDAASKTLSIPTQRQNGLEYKGTGVYTEDLLTINYTVTDTFGAKLVNDACTATLAREQ